MKLLTIGADIAALSAIVGAAANIIPVVIGICGAIYGIVMAVSYSFEIYDRIRYGPQIDGRRKHNDSDTKN